MTTQPYVLEVLEFFPKDKEFKLKHVGYMNKIFKGKNDAILYYNKHNPHMRSLNAHGNYKSDWDPNTHLLYIVRKFYGIKPTIEPFEGVIN